MLICEERRGFSLFFFFEMALPQMGKKAAPLPNAKKIPKTAHEPGLLRRRTEIIPVKGFPHQNKTVGFGQRPRPLHSRYGNGRYMLVV
jgi:hypothetical protein